MPRARHTVEATEAKDSHTLPLGRYADTGSAQQAHGHGGGEGGHRAPRPRGREDHSETQREHDQREHVHAHARGLIGLEFGGRHGAARVILDGGCPGFVTS